MSAERLEAAARAALTSEGPAPTAWSNGPDATYAEHRHAYDKALVAVSGSIEFTLPELGDSVPLDAGDRLDLPAGTLHGAGVGPSGVTCLEAHLRSGAGGDRPRRRAAGVRQRPD